jgi:peptide/nickel transport system substrate-binding protein
MLAEMVETGELPPLEERLPVEPRVIGPGSLLPEDYLDFEVGQYGGTLRAITLNPGWSPDVYCMSREPLVEGPGIAGENLVGNVAESFEVSEDAKVFTFHLRKGLKWSDGTPVTTEDVLFAYEDVLLNEEITPVFPQWLKSGNDADGEPMTLEVIDDYTFRISFTDIYYGFLVQLAIVGWRSYVPLLKPKHYLKQFHVTYTPLEDLEPLIAEEELSEGEWWTLFTSKDATAWDISREASLDCPHLLPWVQVSSTATVTNFERNPYYFKVDEAGQQFPYVDKIMATLVQDVEMITMKVITGEIDYVYAGIALRDVSVLRENEEQGGYWTGILGSHTDPGAVYLNLTHEDPVWREVVRDLRFRQAFNMAINRDDIIETVWLGFGGALPRTVPSEYNPEEAERILDEIGLDQRDADGWRLGPDGERFDIPFEVAARTAELVPTTELVVEHLKSVGLHATMKTISSELRGERGGANQLKATVERSQQPLWWNRGRPGTWYAGGSTWCPLWDLWRTTEGEEGEEPPPEAREFFELTSRSMVVFPDERKKLIEEYEKIFYDNLFYFPTVEDERRPIIAANNLKNVAKDGPTIASAFAGEQFFFES